MLALATLVWATGEYLGKDAWARGAGPQGIVAVCRNAVSERWPGTEAIVFDEDVAMRPLADGQRYVSQFHTARGERVHFACEARPSDDGGWTVSRLSIVSW